MPKTYNDIKFCKEPKTIIVVDKWLNSIKKIDYLLSYGTRNISHPFEHTYPDSPSINNILDIGISFNLEIIQLR